MFRPYLVFNDSLGRLLSLSVCKESRITQPCRKRFRIWIDVVRVKLEDRAVVTHDEYFTRGIQHKANHSVGRINEFLVPNDFVAFELQSPNLAGHPVAINVCTY